MIYYAHHMGETGMSNLDWLKAHLVLCAIIMTTLLLTISHNNENIKLCDITVNFKMRLRLNRLGTVFL